MPDASGNNSHELQCSHMCAAAQVETPAALKVETTFLFDREEEVDLISSIGLPDVFTTTTTVVAYLSPSLQTDDLVPYINEEQWQEAISSIPEGKRPAGSRVNVQEGLIYIATSLGKALWVPPTLRQNVLKLYHNPPASGHRGKTAMGAAMHSEITWSKMEEDIAEYVRH